MISRERQAKVFKVVARWSRGNGMAGVEAVFSWSRCSTCPLVLGCCELSHVIFLKLRKKEQLAKLSKLKNDNHFHSKDNLGPF